MVHTCHIGECSAYCSEELTYGCICVQPPDGECSCDCVMKSGVRERDLALSLESRVTAHLDKVPRKVLWAFLSANARMPLASLPKASEDDTVDAIFENVPCTEALATLGIRIG